MSNKPTVAISADFLTAYAVLPRQKQGKVTEFFNKFRNDPTHPGINFEKINEGIDKNICSVRIDDTYRGIIVRETESNVYMGDIFRWGEALIQVSQPRSPCYKLNYHFDISDIAQLMQNTGKVGWLYSVIAPGKVSADAPLELVSRVSDVTVQEAAAIALAAAGVSSMGLWTQLRIPCTYPLLERVKLELAAAEGLTDDTEYGADVTITASLPQERVEPLCARLTELSAGGIVPAVLGESFRPGPRKEI